MNSKLSSPRVPPSHSRQAHLTRHTSRQVHPLRQRNRTAKLPLETSQHSSIRPSTLPMKQSRKSSSSCQQSTSVSVPTLCPPQVRALLVHCRLQPLCEAFNDENGPGCNNRACKFAHIYRTCTESLDGVECSYMQVKEGSEKKKAHLAKRVHPDAVPKKDWQMRIDIAGLRDAHKEMRY